MFFIAVLFLFFISVNITVRNFIYVLMIINSLIVENILFQMILKEL